MKRTIAIIALLALALSLCACGTTAPVDTPETTTESTAAPDPTYTFDVGFSVTMAADFQEQESQLNDFFGLGDDGAFAIIANKEDKADYTSLESYAKLLAEANGAETAKQDVNGNYYIEYINDNDGYHYYTTIRETETHYLRVAFYCPTDNWTLYQLTIPGWAASVTVTETAADAAASTETTAG